MHGRLAARLIALALFGALALNYPLLSLFSRGGNLFGIPVLYLYLFTIWAGIIAATAWLVRRSERSGQDPGDRG